MLVLKLRFKTYMLVPVLTDKKCCKQVYIRCQYLPFEKFLIKGKIYVTKLDTLISKMFFLNAASVEIKRSRQNDCYKIKPINRIFNNIFAFNNRVFLSGVLFRHTS